LTLFLAQILEMCRKFYDSFVKKETCTQCILNKYCKGIDKEYYENIKENIKAITPE